MPLDKRFDAARREVKESRLLAPLWWAVDATAVEWRESRVVAFVIRGIVSFHALPSAARRRRVVVAIAVAVTVHLLLGMLTPPRLAPLWLQYRFTSLLHRR
jgi:hypothetical protein